MLAACHLWPATAAKIKPVTALHRFFNFFAGKPDGLWPAWRWAGPVVRTQLRAEAWPQAVHTGLGPCLLLALLLHVWLVLMLGSAPAGTARLGQGVWGALNVTLRGPAQDGPVVLVLPALPLPQAGAAGAAPSPRSGGSVRSPSAQAPTQPGAAVFGDWSAQTRVQRDGPVAQAMAPALQPQPASPAPATAEPPGPTLAALLPAGPAALAVLPSVAAAPLTLPALRTSATAPPVSAAPPPAPAERRLGALPSTQALPRVLPLEQLPLAPSVTPVAPAAPPLEQVSAAVAPTVATPVPAPTRVATPTPTPAPPAQTPAPQPEAASDSPLPAPSSPDAPAKSGALVPGSSAGRPDAGAQVGRDVATAPSAPASAPRLNLDLPRTRGGELSRQSSVGVLSLLPRPPELPNKLAREIDKAGKADCRDAYSGLGPLAVLPLALDAVRKEGGCKW